MYSSVCDESLQLSMLEMVFILPLFWEIFHWVKNLGWQFSSLVHKIIAILYLYYLVCILILALLYIMCLLSLVTFKFYSVFLLLESGWCAFMYLLLYFIYIYMLGVWWPDWICVHIMFIKFGKLLPLFLQILFSVPLCLQLETFWLCSGHCLPGRKLRYS